MHQIIKIPIKFVGYGKRLAAELRGNLVLLTEVKGVKKRICERLQTN
jgi:hypothetical protein